MSHFAPFYKRVSHNGNQHVQEMDQDDERGQAEQEIEHNRLGWFPKIKGVSRCIAQYHAIPHVPH